ncbi:MAG: NAD(P)/FAD-dependent oxidoreductase [Hyphomicrobiaceae bacterium]
MQNTKIAVIGSGVSGLCAAWLLSQRHNVVLFEADDRLGGHVNTVTVETCDGPTRVDTGFIVYNAANYPNLTALFSYLDVATSETEMSFSVSMRGGDYEYSGSGFGGFFGQRRNLLNHSHWQVLRDIARFFKTAKQKSQVLGDDVTLGAFLEHERYSRHFIDHHILPMASAIWSADKSDMLDYPARSFISFYANHGMLQFKDRPMWRTVEGGGQTYVDAMLRDSAVDVRRAKKIHKVVPKASGADVIDDDGQTWSFDQVVIATHADQALEMLVAPTPEQENLLKAFRYQRNCAVLHRDATAMPKRRTVWSSWNYIQTQEQSDQLLCVTYWMNRLNNLPTRENLFVTLNPTFEIDRDKVDGVFNYMHPLFSAPARRAQARLWQLQGQRNIWFCGSYFGHGFHEDGIQSGLAVAEQLGGVRRPWDVKNESGRIFLASPNATLEDA